MTCLETSVLQLSGIVFDQSDACRFPLQTTVYVSGTRVPAELRKLFRGRFGAPLFVHYGAQEFGRIATTYPGGHDDVPESVGAPVPWIDFEIVDDAGKALPAGEIGKVRVRSDCMSREYHQDPIATFRHFADGWFYPGDLGTLTPRNALCLLAAPTT